MSGMYISPSYPSKLGQSSLVHYRVAATHKARPGLKAYTRRHYHPQGRHLGELGIAALSLVVVRTSVTTPLTNWSCEDKALLHRAVNSCPIATLSVVAVRSPCRCCVSDATTLGLVLDPNPAANARKGKWRAVVIPETGGYTESCLS